jgi:hypothetical protein
MQLIQKDPGKPRDAVDLIRIVASAFTSEVSGVMNGAPKSRRTAAHGGNRVWYVEVADGIAYGKNKIRIVIMTGDIMRIVGCVFEPGN